jgi:hypothetical protein
LFVGVAYLAFIAYRQAKLTMEGYVCPNPQCGRDFPTSQKLRDHYRKTKCSKSVEADQRLLLSSLPIVSGSGQSCLPVADLNPLAPRVSQPPSSLLAKGRTPPRKNDSLQTRQEPATKKTMIQHGGVEGSTTETAQESFPDNHHDDYDDFGLSSTLQDEDAATSVEEEVFVSIPPLPSNNRSSLNNPMQNVANATYIDCMVGNVVQLTTEEKAVIDLLSLIEEFRIPVRSFKAILKWASKWSNEKADFKDMAKTTRKVFMKKISKRIGYDSLKPVIDIVSMPFAGKKYNLPVFSFIAAFTAMITDPRLMKEEFLQFNKAGDIMAPPPLRRRIATDWLGDTNHGEYCRKAYKEVIERPNEQFLVTLMFFADRTHTDRKGLLTLEPLLFCPCSLFNLKARQLHEFWSLLGYLPYAANYQYGGDAGGQNGRLP